MGAVAPMVTYSACATWWTAAWRGVQYFAAFARALITTFSSPQTPLRMGCQPGASICLMDKSTYGMDMWTRLRLDHMPTPSEPLPTGVRPTGLTRFACPTFFFKKTENRGRRRDLPPFAR